MRLRRRDIHGPLGRRRLTHSPERLQSLLQFMLGIVVGAFTTVFTSLQRQHLVWRAVAAVLFAVSAILLYRCTLVADQALREARAGTHGRPDLIDQEFHASWSMLHGQLLASGGVATIVAAVAVLMVATLLH